MRDLRTADEKERDELHARLVYIRGVEHEPMFDQATKDEMTRKHYARVVWLNTPVNQRHSPVHAA